MKRTPPILAKHLLRSFLREDLAEEVSGDLEEKFYKTINKKGKFRAKVNYWYQVLRYVRPFAIRKSRNTSINQSAMLKNYLKIGMRNLAKNKVYSFINIGGLAVGMTVAILIGLWVFDELSFNRHHQNYDQVARLMRGGTDKNGTWSGGTSHAFPLVDVLRTQYGQNFKHLVEATSPAESILTSGDVKTSVTGQFMGAGVLEMLSLDMVHGNWNALKEPYSIVLSAATAKVLLGETNPIGQVIRINTNLDVKVTGVFRDLPQNTTFNNIKFFVPFELWVMRNAGRDQDWENHFLRIYCQIAPGMTMEQVGANIGQAQIEAIRGIGQLQNLIDEKPTIQLSPMRDWHLRSSYSWPNHGEPDMGPVRMVWLVGMIGGFVLVLACINFMNLSTARSEKRAREVGIRKSMGSARSQLVRQFFSESYLVVLFAFAASLLLAFIALPSFNGLAGKIMTMPIDSPRFWIASALFIFVTGLMAGSYPAFYLSSFNPVKVLKGTFRSGRLASLPRKILVVLQFTVSVTLIIGTIIVYNQILFAKNRPVGYTREGLIMVQKKSNDFQGKTEVLRQELKKTGVVEEISESGWKMTMVWSNNGGFDWKGKDPDLHVNFGTLGVSPEYGTTVRWEFIDGRDFSADLVSDSSAFVVTESVVKLMGLEKAVGETIHWKNKFLKVDKDFHIIGVIKDLVMESPFEQAKPTVFLFQNYMGCINIKIKPEIAASEALPKIESVFRAIIPSSPFDYQFVDEEYALKFAAEERIGNLALIFAVLAVLISCLGLFGLASFVAEQRTKEIGIRKVVGASVVNLWKLLSGDFVVLVLISGVIAVPIAWFALSAWLINYAYRITISPWTFVISIAGAVILTLGTVSYQAIRVAMRNPVHSLRTE